jgi:uncharacterized protein (DUF1499 family)
MVAASPGGLAVQRSRIATLSAVLAVIGAMLFAGGPIAIHAGVATPLSGFYAFALGGIVFGLAALVLGALGLYVTRPAATRGGRGLAVLGSGLGLLMVGAVFAGASSGGGLPPINDITTNTEDPPVFAHARELEANRGRDMSYPGEAFARQQHAAYPDLEPIRLDISTGDAYEKALTAIGGFGWVITRSDRYSGSIEATDTTPVFRFVDDIVVRIREVDGVTVVDVRSKSRDGRGDLGTNAARIRALRDALRE